MRGRPGVLRGVSAPTELGTLGDPSEHLKPIDIRGEDPSRLVRWLERMVMIRAVEEAVAAMVASGEARCPCHLAIGQEAPAVGVAAHLRPSDRVFGGHRSHAHYLALGGDPARLFAEILGRATGCSSGMGGSMHLLDTDHGLRGTVPIVAATIPIAAGAALASVMDGSDDVAVSFFGDGATEEGVFHETLNLAAYLGLPMVFVCENNFFSSHLHISQRQPHTSTARYAAPHSIPARVVDGNDVVAVARAAGELVARARRGEGPGLLEAVTYRWKGHVGHRDDIDVGVKRRTELELWRRRDPVRRLRDALVEIDVLSTDELTDLTRSTELRVANAVGAAREAPFPPTSLLFDAVFPSRGRGR